MDAKFMSIVAKLAADHGKDTLLDAIKTKALLSDYAQQGFEKERRLLLIAIEAGAAQEIANANDLEVCKEIQTRLLNQERLIDESLAAEVVDLLALVLRGDRNKSIVTPPQQSQNTNYYQQSGYSQAAQNPSVEYVGFWARFLASIIDNVLLTAFVLVLILGAVGFFDSMSDKEIEIFEYFISAAVSLIYVLGFWTSRQATPGKMALKAKIVDAQTLGKPTAAQFVGRYIAYSLSAIPLCLGFLWVAFDARKRGWHDMLAGTLVIKDNGQPLQYGTQQPQNRSNSVIIILLVTFAAFVVILGIIAAVALPRFSGVQDDAMIAAERSGIGSVRSSLQAIRGRAILYLGRGVTMKTLDCYGNQHTVTILPYSDAAPNDEKRLNKSGYPNSLSVRSWRDPTPSRASSGGECSTALALVLEPEGREGYTTEAYGSQTIIRGPATGSGGVTDPNAELNVDKCWLYDPASGNITLATNCARR
ncbi:MAG: RDD family protein [Helicobacteraceae bacterium]|jgi:uncharacterized RDD family membrane protein YckC/type II secretory pathway pseudopilin PulG|nr:RDD family protein [Helicobacteraceae bacterium]